jgi:hypothetical protein
LFIIETVVLLASKTILPAMTKRSASALFILSISMLFLLSFSTNALAGFSIKKQTFSASYFSVPKGYQQSGTSGISNGSYIYSPLSYNGRFLFFTSYFNFQAGPSQPGNKLFRRDNQTGRIMLAARKGKSGKSIDTVGEIKASANGRIIAFASQDQALPEDTDDTRDIYVKNISTGQLKLITADVTSNINQFDLSDDGQWITFSTQTPLVPGDLNDKNDVYRRNIETKATDLVSRIPAANTPGNDQSYSGSVSGDGRWVAFRSLADNLVAGYLKNNASYETDAFLRDMQTGVTYLISSKFDSSLSGGNGDSNNPVIAGSPSELANVQITFESYSTDLADNGVVDPSTSTSVYYKNMPETASELISRATGAGASANSRAHSPSISNDGKKIIFSSDASNLGPDPDYYGVYLRNRTTQTTTLVSQRNEYAVQGAISGDGQTASWPESEEYYPGGDPDLQGIFIRSLPSGKIRLASKPLGSKKLIAAGFYSSYNLSQANRISANSRYIVFSTGSRRLTGSSGSPQVFRRDLKTGKIELVSRKTGRNGPLSDYSGQESISNSGNIIAFQSSSALVPEDTNNASDIYIRNMNKQTTSLVSVDNNGQVADSGAEQGLISGNGNRVVFLSQATNLDGTPGKDSVYIRDLTTGKTILVSRATGPSGAAANQDSFSPSLSYNGKRVVFQSFSTNLDPDNGLGYFAITMRDTSTNATTTLSRSPGLDGSVLDIGFAYPMISGDGKKVVFQTESEATVPDSAPWTLGSEQIVVRTVSNGENKLISSSAGQAGSGRSSEPTINHDGSTIAFSTGSSNIRSDASDGSPQIVFWKNNSFQKPPAFSEFATQASLNRSGNCLLFSGQGDNRIEENMANINSIYIYTAAKRCYNPRVLTPVISRVVLKPRAVKKGKISKQLRIKFRLNRNANVYISASQGKKVLMKTVRRGKKGQRTIRVPRKWNKLKKGTYRIAVYAQIPGNTSKKVIRRLKVK